LDRVIADRVNEDRVVPVADQGQVGQGPTIAGQVIVRRVGRFLEVRRAGREWGRVVLVDRA
jgi:hypothetical protein